jgi:hypothetical protein
VSLSSNSIETRLANCRLTVIVVIVTCRPRRASAREAWDSWRRITLARFEELIEVVLRPSDDGGGGEIEEGN